MKTLSELDTPWKLLFTSFLTVLSSGFVVSELYLMETTEMADGKSGLSLKDITLTFHGSDVPRLTQQAQGPMKKYFSTLDDAGKLTPEEQADLEKVTGWVEHGAPESDYWNAAARQSQQGQIQFILNMHGCLDCHSPDATVKGNKKDSPLDTYAAISKFTKANPGMSNARLLSLSHIHLLGMGLMFLATGAAVAVTLWPAWMRSVLAVGGLGSVLLDIFGWWGVKWGGEAYSPLVMAGGILMGAAFAGSVAAALYDLWVRRRGSRG